MDKTLLQNQITGLQARLKELETQQRLFERASGLDESIAITQRDREHAETDLIGAKDQLAKFQNEKAKSLTKTTGALAENMSKILPEGKALFRIDEEGLFIGWEHEGKISPWPHGLSGGQRPPFDQALASALLGDGEKIIILEGAELDEAHLVALMKKLIDAPKDTQIILNHYLMPKLPDEVAKEWKIVEVK